MNTETNRQITLKNSKHVLTFKSKVDAATYLKMDDDTQRICYDENGNRYVPLLRAIKYFSNLCLNIQDEKGINKSVSNSYLEDLEIEDLNEIKAVCEEIITLKAKAVSISK